MQEIIIEMRRTHKTDERIKMGRRNEEERRRSKDVNKVGNSGAIPYTGVATAGRVSGRAGSQRTKDSSRGAEQAAT
jgi:hypothetical protein